MKVRRAINWKICADPANAGLGAGWQNDVPPEATNAPVPGIIQQIFPDYHGIAWYWCELGEWPVPAGHRALIRFESVDYAARVWVNGQEIGAHEGDGVPFELDATEFLNAGRPNLVAVRVINPAREPIDGLVLAEVPHSNKAVAGEFRPGAGYNSGGIIGEVVVRVEPDTRLLDVFVRSHLGTGVISVDVAVRSAGPTAPTDGCGRPGERRQYRVPCRPCPRPRERRRVEQRRAACPRRAAGAT